MKKLISRLTTWQVEPVASHLDVVTDRMREDLHDLDDRLAVLERRLDP